MPRPPLSETHRRRRLYQQGQPVSVVCVQEQKEGGRSASGPPSWPGWDRPAVWRTRRKDGPGCRGDSFCGVVVADPFYSVAQRGQQTWEICIPDEIHLGICETPCCVLGRVFISFPAESKNSPARHPIMECPAGLLLLSQVCSICQGRTCTKLLALFLYSRHCFSGKFQLQCLTVLCQGVCVR